MAKEKAFHISIRSKRELRSVNFSYRRYNRLPPKEKAIFDKVKVKYYPSVWRVVLYLRYKYKLPISRGLFRRAKKLLPEFENALLEFNRNHNFAYCCFHNCDKYYAKEFQFHGFVPLQNYRIRKGFVYITSNRIIENVYWIYPTRFGDDYRIIEKGYKNWIEPFSNISISGVTRIHYAKDYNKLKKTWIQIKQK